MSALVVNLFGGPGAGKSTMAAGIFEKLKWAGVDVELAAEFAKDLVWEERHKTFEDQIYIFGKQHHRIERLVEKVEVVITDSPLILSAIYAPFDYPESFKQLVLDRHNSFRNLNLLVERLKPYNPNGRNQDEEGAKAIDVAVTEYLNYHGLAYAPVFGSPSGVLTATKAILALVGRNADELLKTV